jgi:hypothetical protein
VKAPVILQEGRPYKECAKLGEGEGVSPECVGIRMTYYRCKRGQVGQSFCHFEVCMGAKSSSIDIERSEHPLQLLKIGASNLQGHFRAARNIKLPHVHPQRRQQADPSDNLFQVNPYHVHYIDQSKHFRNAPNWRFKFQLSMMFWLFPARNTP